MRRSGSSCKARGPQRKHLLMDILLVAFTALFVLLPIALLGRSTPPTHLRSTCRLRGGRRDNLDLVIDGEYTVVDQRQEKSQGGRLRRMRNYREWTFFIANVRGGFVPHGTSPSVPSAICQAVGIRSTPFSSTPLLVKAATSAVIEPLIIEADALAVTHSSAEIAAIGRALASPDRRPCRRYRGCRRQSE